MISREWIRWPNLLGGASWSRLREFIVSLAFPSICSWIPPCQLPMLKCNGQVQVYHLIARAITKAFKAHRNLNFKYSAPEGRTWLVSTYRKPTLL